MLADGLFEDALKDVVKVFSRREDVGWVAQRQVIIHLVGEGAVEGNPQCLAVLGQYLGDSNIQMKQVSNPPFLVDFLV